MGNAVRSLYGQCCKPEPGNKNILYVFVPTPVNSPIYVFSSDLLTFQKTSQVDQKAIGDGDSMTVYVSTSIPRESRLVPDEVLVAVDERSKACAVRDYDRADALRDEIKEAGYQMRRIGDNEEILARKYRIQLKGIDAPEVDMPYGEEAKNELARIVGGRTLKVLVYDIDQYDRCVGDVYCNGVFVQKLMLKRGMAWHYIAYDQRPDFAKWEKEARLHQRGLWAASNPEKPWEWRKQNLR